MRDTLAKIGAWGRRIAILAALLGAPTLLAAPAAQAQPVGSVTISTGQPMAAMPVQWGPPPRPYYYGPPPRRHYHGPRHWHRPPPPPHWRRHHAYRGYPPPPPRHHRRHWHRY
ncbi:hypothetical protein J8J14_00805 [Roseomonas sp. SSH11]|uniref:Uncharacterized protein n=1 Tax=Pararoseomonas baculiformis TaxID=2820812 RepID=A0ABS4AAI5_9PROT|nr:hypothetical protein [Pararoseomonas baculiformis]MBP0443304.1 hypothetical protein [Pararoseomonas baculiformis]